MLVQSGSPADWSALDAFPGYALEIHGNKPVDLERLIQAGTRYRFRLHANPTVTREGKRLGLCQGGRSTGLVESSGGDAGFQADRLSAQRQRTNPCAPGQERAPDHPADRLVRGHPGDEVTEWTAPGVLSGLGHGKAWGLGLLSLARWLDQQINRLVTRSLASLSASATPKPPPGRVCCGWDPFPTAHQPGRIYIDVRGILDSLEGQRCKPLSSRRLCRVDPSRCQNPQRSAKRATRAGRGDVSSRPPERMGRHRTTTRSSLLLEIRY